MQLKYNFVAYNLNMYVNKEFFLCFNRKAFQQFYKEHMEYSCPTEDIFLE